MGWGASGGDGLERSLHNNVLPLRYQFGPTSKDRPHCDHSCGKVEPDRNEVMEERWNTRTRTAVFCLRHFYQGHTHAHCLYSFAEMLFFFFWLMLFVR